MGWIEFCIFVSWVQGKSLLFLFFRHLTTDRERLLKCVVFRSRSVPNHSILRCSQAACSSPTILQFVGELSKAFSTCLIFLVQLSASLWNVYLYSGFCIPLAEFILWKLKLSMILCKDIASAADQKEHWVSWGHFIIAFQNTNESTLRRRYFIWILPNLISFINSIIQCSCSLSTN